MRASLRTILLSAMITSAGFSAVTYTSCTEDKCKAIVCAYNGTCVEGKCVCPQGYEGPQCETINRDRFKGVWQVTEDGTLSNAAQYPVSIENGDAGITGVKIKNFRNFFTGFVTATVKGDTMYIDQPMQLNGYNIEGFASLQDDKYYGDHGKLVVYYRVTELAHPDLVDDFGYSGGIPSRWNK